MRKNLIMSIALCTAILMGVNPALASAKTIIFGASHDGVSGANGFVTNNATPASIQSALASAMSRGDSIVLAGGTAAVGGVSAADISSAMAIANPSGSISIRRIGGIDRQATAAAINSFLSNGGSSLNITGGTQSTRSELPNATGNIRTQGGGGYFGDYQTTINSGSSSSGGGSSYTPPAPSLSSQSIQGNTSGIVFVDTDITLTANASNASAIEVTNTLDSTITRLTKNSRGQFEGTYHVPLEAKTGPITFIFSANGAGGSTQKTLNATVELYGVSVTR